MIISDCNCLNPISITFYYVVIVTFWCIIIINFWKCNCLCITNIYIYIFSLKNFFFFIHDIDSCSLNLT